MFSIVLIQDKEYIETKWLCWRRNVRIKGFANLISFSKDMVELYMNDRKTTQCDPIKALTIDTSGKDIRDIYISAIREKDLMRKFTLQEYTLLGTYLKAFGYKYNKKKDEFIKAETNV